MKWQMWVAVLALVVGAFLPMSPVSTWTNADSETTGAPVASGPAGGDGLNDARRATSDAASQLGLLTAGTGQLVDGVGQLDDGTTALIDALTQAEAGAHELSGGMVQLQAGTGQLASGATQVADAIGGVVEQVSGFDAVRGQVVATIDRTLESTRDSEDPDVVAAREALTALREQALTAEVPPEALAQMNQLRDGSREVANQLSVPGYAYHDGVYTATNGAAALASGLSEITAQSGEAREGVDALVDGAGRIDTMAKQSADKVGAVRAALPAAPVAQSAGAAGAAGSGEEQATPASLSPIAAMLVAALLTLGGVVLAGAALFVGRAGGAPRVVLSLGAVLLAAAGFILIAVLSTGFGAVQLALAALAVLLGAFAATGLAASLSAALGILPGLGIASVLALAQVGIVGWVWRTAATAPVADAWLTASSAAPMHWTTAALSTIGNGGAQEALISGLLASVVMGAVGLASARRL